MAGPLALVALAGAALYFAWGYGLWDLGAPGAGLMPSIAATLLAAMSLLSLREKPPVEEEGESDPRRLLRYSVALVALVPAIMVVGMLPALGLFILLCLRLAERMSWRSALTIAICGMGGSWLLFERLLQVPLPRGLWS